MYTRQKASELRNEIVTLREENPNMTLREIGEIVNRTRERVRQILTSEDAETRSAKRIESDNRPDPICRVCNKSFSDINIVGLLNFSLILVKTGPDFLLALSFSMLGQP